MPADDHIRLLQLEGSPGIGDKRNLGCDRARGDVIAHWDDDDYSAPGRLSDQMARLLESGKVVTGYHSMRFTDGKRWWLWEFHSRHKALGTSLCYWREFWRTNKFHPIQIGEDSAFVADAARLGQIVTADAGDLMYANIHEQSTSPHSMHWENWKAL